MSESDVLVRLVNRLIEAPGSNEGWQSFLLELCDALDGSAASFISQDLLTRDGSIAVTARTDPEALGLYNQHWSREDPWARNMTPDVLRSGAVFPGDILISHAKLKRTAYYTDFARRYGIVRCVAGMIEAEPEAFSCISINGTEARAPFGAGEQRLLLALMKPIRRAVDLHRRLGAAELRAGSVETVLNRLSHGVLLVSAEGRVQFENDVARRILAARDGLLVERNELRGATSDDTRRLREAIADATRLATGQTNGDTLVHIERSGMKARLSVLVTPLPPGRVPLASPQTVVAVFVTAPELLAPATPEMLRAMFGLTPAESELVTKLIEGLTLNQAADSLQLARDTVRKRLKAVFLKTETHSQAQLMRLVLSSAPPSFGGNTSTR